MNNNPPKDGRFEIHGVRYVRGGLRVTAGSQVAWSGSGLLQAEAAVHRLAGDGWQALRLVWFDGDVRGELRW